MNTGWLLFYLFLLIISWLGAGGFLIALGLRGILSKNPVVLAAYHFLWWVLPTGMALAAFIGLFLLPRDWLAFTPVLLFFGFCCALAAARRQFTGYRLLGVEAAALRRMLLETLDTLGIEHQDGETHIRLLALNAELHVGIQAWLGMAFIRLSGSGQRETLRQIIQGIRDELKTTGYRAQGRAFRVSLAVGLLALGFAACVVLSVVVVMLLIEGMW